MSRPGRSVAGVGAVAVLVVLAGCGGVLPGDGSGSASGGESLTPAPVPDSSVATGAVAGGAGDPDAGDPSTTPAYPPGVDADGIRNRSALFAAHRAVLAGQSYRITAVRRVVRPERETIYRGAAVANGSTYLVTYGRNRTALTYVDPSGRYTRGFDRVDGRITNVTAGATAVGPPTAPPVVAGLRYLATNDAAVTWVERDGERLVRLFVARGPSIRAIRGNYSLTLYVRPDGLVRTFVVDATGPDRTADAAFTERYTYTGIGATTVTEPDWVRRAKDNRSATAPTVDPPSTVPVTTARPENATGTDRIGNETDAG